MEKKIQKRRASEIKKKMKRLSIAPKAAGLLTKSDKATGTFGKEKETNETKKKEANKQKITQRVKVNVNIPTSLSSQPSSYLPSQYNNREQTTLLKSINEQLKQKNEPSSVSQIFNIPDVSSPAAFGKKQIETQTEPKQTYEYSTQTEPKKPKQTYEYSTQTKPTQSKEYSTQTEPKQTYEYSTQTKPNQAYEYSTQTEPIENEDDILEEELRKERLKLERSLPPQFSEKNRAQPIISDKIENMPIINKPSDLSNLSLLEQIKEQAEKKKPGRKKMTEEEKAEKEMQRKEEEKIQREETKKQKELDNIEKELEIEAKRELERVQKEIANKQKKKDIKQQISDKAFNVLLSETPESEKGRLRRQYEVDDLSDPEIKAILKQRYGYTAEEVKRIFSLK